MKGQGIVEFAAALLTFVIGVCVILLVLCGLHACGGL